jgi:signal transduction histidine kinase
VIHSIRGRLLLAFLLPAAGFFFLTAAVAYWVGRRSLEEEVNRGLIAMAEAAAAVVPADRLTILAPGDEASRTYSHIAGRLEAQRKASGVRRIYLFDRERRAIVDIGTLSTPGTIGSAAGLRIGTHLPYLEKDRLEIERVFSSGTATASSVSFEDGGEIFTSAYAPVRSPTGEIIAAVGVDASARHFAVIRRFALLIASIAAAGVLVVSALAIAVAGTVTRPLRHLVEAARTIGEGDLSTRVEAPSRDEVGALADSLDEMREALRERNEELQRMLAGVAHEVRNPLGGIDLFSGLLGEGLRDRPELSGYVERIRKELKNLEAFVEDFLAYARERPPQFEACQAIAFLGEVADLARAGALERKQSLALDVSPMTFQADAPSLRRAVLNLLRNAVQAAPEGGHVTLSCSGRDGHVEIRVEDDGPGVPAELRGDLFKRFFTTKEKGLGLGLAYVRKVAEAHGGSARLEDAERGAAFLIRIPTEPPAPGAKQG